MRYLLVDGHSMIFAWPDLASLHRVNAGSARRKLVARMAAFQDATGERVVIVFDGRGERHDSGIHDDGVQVIYSKSGRTADSVIERLAANYASRHDLRVATNDHAEQMTVSAFGASFLSSTRLAEEIDRAANDLARRLRSHNKRGARQPVADGSPFDVLVPGSRSSAKD